MKMSEPFSPSFKHFQRDIERFLIASGLREKRKDGFTVFKGYENALQTMFNHYLDAGKFDPLVAHFRNWNWEMGCNDYLLSHLPLCGGKCLGSNDRSQAQSRFFRIRYKNTPQVDVRPRWPRLSFPLSFEPS